MTTDSHAAELDSIRKRYARRATDGKMALYDPLLPVNIVFRQERERALASLLRPFSATRPLSSLRILEIGCGAGGNIADFIRWGAAPERCVGNELLPERLEQASHRLPAAVHLVPGDASALDFADQTFDIVLQSTVFSSVLDPSVQEQIATNMWRMLAPGGCVLWYDFTMGNPNNPDVVGVRPKRLRQLFPEARYSARRVTLAPPLARQVSKIHPMLYHPLNYFPLLRTHLFARLDKLKSSSF